MHPERSKVGLDYGLNYNYAGMKQPCRAQQYASQAELNAEWM